MDISTHPVPRGFKVTVAENGNCTILYRTTDMGCVAVFFGVCLSGWTIGCTLFTARALLDPEGIHYWLLLFMVPFWVIEFVTVGYVAWFFWSVTRFAFTPDELVVERSLLWYRHRRVFLRREVTTVKQVKDGGEGEDSFPTWGLVVVARTAVKVLSRQPIDKSNWLGPVIARWAGVPYVPTPDPEYETL